MVMHVPILMVCLYRTESMGLPLGIGPGGGCGSREMREEEVLLKVYGCKRTVRAG